MTRPKMSRYPVSSFGPELMAVLLKGARERVELPCDDQRHMKFLQMRLQMLRGAMAREGHPDYTLVTRARTTRTWDRELGKDVNCVLVVQPNDIQFTDTIRKAGIEVDDINVDDVVDAPDILPDPIVDPILNPYSKFKD